MNIDILYIEDDSDNREELKEALSGEVINDCSISLTCEESFDDAVQKAVNYHLIILDLMKGEDNLGESIFNQIKESFFMPIIFYAAKTAEVETLRSQVVGVVSKLDGIDALKSEIERLTKYGLPFLRKSVHGFIDQKFNSFFWSTIQAQNNVFKAGEEDFSLGYLLLRNFADSLSKDNIKGILEDSSIKDDKVHPMEFYIYPMEKAREFECGEIVIHKESRDVFVILTPSCDFIKRKGKKRRVEYVLLAKTTLLTSTAEYNAVVDINGQIEENEKKSKALGVDEKALEELCKTREKLAQTKNTKYAAFKQFINSGSSDRYFFLPGTPFIEDRVIDFQDKLTVRYESLSADFERLTKLDNPYAQSMVSSFIRYYNRIGFPDIDADYIISRLGI